MPPLKFLKDLLAMETMKWNKLSTRTRDRSATQQKQKWRKGGDEYLTDHPRSGSSSHPLQSPNQLWGSWKNPNPTWQANWKKKEPNLCTSTAVGGCVCFGTKDSVSPLSTLVRIQKSSGNGARVWSTATYSNLNPNYSNRHKAWMITHVSNLPF